VGYRVCKIILFLGREAYGFLGDSGRVEKDGKESTFQAYLAAEDQMV
jgi:hypothetical protein